MHDKHPAIDIANRGYKKAAVKNPEIAKGINIIDGKVTHEGVAAAFGLSYTPLQRVLKQKTK